jgi:hypothetical protein
MSKVRVATITIHILTSDGEKTFFKVKPKPDRMKINPSSFRLLLDGERVDYAHTVKELELEDGDSILYMKQQDGGRL